MEKLQFITENLVNGNKEWFLDNGIIVKEKGDFWILNYHQFADKNEYNILTRGLVIDKSGNLVSCPFFRFFNYGEPLAAQVDFSRSDVLEKLDGSLVGVCFPNGIENPVWHFRNLISSHQKDRDFAIKSFVLNETESSLLLEVEPYLKEIEFPEKIKEWSLVFEFISGANTIVTRYKPQQYGLYLIGARSLISLREMHEDDLDILAERLNVRRPRRWQADSYEEILEMMNDFPKDYEGFVIRDRVTGERIKIKSADYLRRHRLLTKLNYRNLIPLWFQGERSEIEAYFPQTKKIFDEIETCYHRFINQALITLYHWRSKKVSRKEVAIGIVGKEPKPICAIVFKFLEEENFVQKVCNHIKEMRVENLIEAWGLKDDLVEEVVSQI